MHFCREKSLLLRWVAGPIFIDFSLFLQVTKAVELYAAAGNLWVSLVPIPAGNHTVVWLLVSKLWVCFASVPP